MKSEVYCNMFFSLSICLNYKKKHSTVARCPNFKFSVWSLTNLNATVLHLQQKTAYLVGFLILFFSVNALASTPPPPFNLQVHF